MTDPLRQARLCVLRFLHGGVCARLLLWVCARLLLWFSTLHHGGVHSLTSYSAGALVTVLRARPHRDSFQSAVGPLRHTP